MSGAALHRVARVALAALSLLLCRPAFAQPNGFLSAREHVQSARTDPRYSFCSKPKRPFDGRQRELCPLAEGVDGCEGFVAVCKGARPADDLEKPKDRSWSEALRSLGALAKFLVWLLVALVLVAIAIPLIRAFTSARRDKAIADERVRPNTAQPAKRPPPPEPETISDAEAALREADEHARRGDYGRALSLYLAASLAALDRRGAIRLARHRTNGEYVRACAEDASRQPLREIVREVDKVEFGKLPPTGESVAHVASRATAVVRPPATGRHAASIATTAMTMLLFVLVLPLAGCGGARGTHAARAVDDPAGDQLPIDVLGRSGYKVSHLATSLAALPIPAAGETAPVVVIDVTRVELEEETRAHLFRWVDEGGVLVLFGPPRMWPKELQAEEDLAEHADLEVLTSEVFARGAHVTKVRSLKWADSEPVAWIGKSVYAAHITHGKGVILGVAGEELFTNIGVARPDNAAAFVGFFDIAMSERRSADARRGIYEPSSSFEVRVARQQDGIPPPSNPFSALVQAGLGKGAWHALAAAIILFLAFGIRQARARPAAPPARRAFAEHVEATGAFYGRARALGHALASYGRFAEMRLRERVPRGADPVQFLATRAKIPHADAARLWKRATEAKADDPPRGDELMIIRDLGAMLAKALDTAV